MSKKTVKDLDIKDKKVIARVDFNVPLDNGVITDDTRIKAAIPTIKYILDGGAKLILCAHLGRPGGKVDTKYSLKPCATRLSELLNMKVTLADDVVGPSAQKLCSEVAVGEIVMLENVRYMPGEKKNDEALSKQFAALADVYVNDAFGAAHRAHSSTVGIAAHLPSGMGFLMEKELRIIGAALADPKRPFIAILGGAKVKDKIGVIKNLLDKVDMLLIGGGMSYTFQVALGGQVGDSLLDKDNIEFAGEMIELARSKSIKLLLPVDNEAGQEFSNDTLRATFHSRNIPDGWEGLDIGPDTQKIFCGELEHAKTVIWNGPMGVSEFPNFAAGTYAVAETLANIDAVTIIGGGDSAAAAEKLGFADKMTHISTGGGASLELLEGKVLPGIAALSDK